MGNCPFKARLKTVAGMIDPENDDIFVGQAIRDEDGQIHPYRQDDQFWAGSTSRSKRNSRLSDAQ